MRVLLFTGKGGVGKTSVAAATALRAADSGHRTLVMSTDPAHSLADVMDCAVGAEPTKLGQRLWAQQLNAQERLEESWGEIRDYLVKVFDWAGASAIEAEELAVLPGLDEVFSLADIRTHVDSGQWDVLVVDCAPTAETIRMLSLPDILGWYMERVFPIGRRVTRLVGPVLSRLTSVPVVDDSVLSAVERFYLRLEGVREVLTDGKVTSARLVVNAERMVIAEARRTYTYLSLFGYRVDAVIVNRLLPEAVSDPWFDDWKRLQEAHLRTIEDGFAPVPVLRAELSDRELIGAERLRDFAASLYGEVDPTSRMSDGDTLRIDRVGDDYVLTIPLPFADRDELEIGRRDDELLVSVGAHRRAVMLPDSLRSREVGDATLKAGTLVVTFGAQVDERTSAQEPTSDVAPRGKEQP